MFKKLTSDLKTILHVNKWKKKKTDWVSSNLEKKSNDKMEAQSNDTLSRKEAIRNKMNMYLLYILSVVVDIANAVNGNFAFV